ncbi:MAG TPA: voltage-gated potassium channel, partial [Burkholderiales bacterium]
MGAHEARERIDAARATLALTVRQRCFYLFCALVLLIVAVPLYEESRAGRIALNIMSLLILLSGASAIGRGGGSFVISLLLAAPAGIFQMLG